jgi:hypothetical protein
MAGFFMIIISLSLQKETTYLNPKKEFIKTQAKNISIDEYRKKLLLKIAKAGSEKDVRRYIDTAINAMHKKRVNGHLVARFISKVSDQMNDQHAADDPVRERNYKIAKEMIPSILQQLNL